MTMLNKWDPWYKDAVAQQPYGDSSIYFHAEEWLKGLDIEDWGCGYAWFKTVHTSGRYIGVDGTDSRWCDVVADLREFQSTPDGILLRGVLEHNYDWQPILDNAVKSFRKRLCLILFTPIAEETHIIAENVGGLGVPDISFSRRDITERLIDCHYEVETVPSSSGYGPETIFKVQR